MLYNTSSMNRVLVVVVAVAVLLQQHVATAAVGPVSSIILPIRPVTYDGSVTSPIAWEEPLRGDGSGPVQFYLGYDISNSPTALVFQVSKADLNANVVVTGCDNEIQWHSMGATRTRTLPNYLFFVSSECIPTASASSVSVSILANTILVPSATRQAREDVFLDAFQFTAPL